MVDLSSISDVQHFKGFACRAATSAGRSSLGRPGHRAGAAGLDEPESAGLDPYSCSRDILEAVIRAIADDGRTVLFSPHLLNEVSVVADQVTMITRKIGLEARALDDLPATHRCWTLRFAERRGPIAAAGAGGSPRLEGTGRRLTARCITASRARFGKAAAGVGAQVSEEPDAGSLDEHLRPRGHPAFPPWWRSEAMRDDSASFAWTLWRQYGVGIRFQGISPILSRRSCSAARSANSRGRTRPASRGHG